MNKERLQAIELGHDFSEALAKASTDWCSAHVRTPGGDVFPIAMLLGIAEAVAHLEGAKAMVVMQVARTDEQRRELAKLISDVQAYEEGRARCLVAKVLSEPRGPSSEAGDTSTATPPE